MPLRSLLAKDWVLEVDTRASGATAPQWTRVNGLTLVQRVDRRQHRGRRELRG
jgi:hypothetical protein